MIVFFWRPLMAQMVKHLPAMWETQVQFLVGKIPWRRNGSPLQYSCLENSMDGRAWQAAVRGLTKSQTRLSDFTFMHWRRQWQPTPVFLPGESQGWGSLVGFRLWGHTKLDTTEVTQQQQQHRNEEFQRYQQLEAFLGDHDLKILRANRIQKDQK